MIAHTKKPTEKPKKKDTAIVTSIIHTSYTGTEKPSIRK